MDPFHSLDILKNQFASIAFCRNSAVYNVRNGAVIELPVVVSIKGFPVVAVVCHGQVRHQVSQGSRCRGS